MKKLIGSIDRITGTTAYILLNDDVHVLQFPVELLPEGADEGKAYTITIEANEGEEQRLDGEIAALRRALDC